MVRTWACGPHWFAVEHEAERRGHAGSIARGQELQRQVTGLQAQLDSNQAAFSRDLGKSKQAVQDAVARGDAAERKAMLEVDQERQTRLKAEKLLEKFREQALESKVQARDAALKQAQEIGSLKSLLASAETARDSLNEEKAEAHAHVKRLEREPSEAVQRSARLDAEAITVRAMMPRPTLAIERRLKRMLR